MKVVGFVFLLWALGSGAWWLYLLAAMFWLLGSGSVLGALWVESKFHREDSDHGP